jgi:hypothetical protein
MKNLLKLGRWCHPSSEAYKNKCDQIYKMALANSDSCSVSHYNLIEKPKIKKKENEDNYKNPVTALFAGYFGN